ncbi:hypothetical protein GINT2_000333 [Glugoides intestinalis]
MVIKKHEKEIKEIQEVEINKSEPVRQVKDAISSAENEYTQYYPADLQQNSIYCTKTQKKYDKINEILGQQANMKVDAGEWERSDVPKDSYNFDIDTKKLFKDRRMIQRKDNTFKKSQRHAGLPKEKPPLFYLEEVSSSCTSEHFSYDLDHDKGSDIECKLELASIPSIEEGCPSDLTLLELEAILGILKMKRIYKDQIYKKKGYKYKTDFQIRVLNDVLRITPYPSSQALDALGTLLNLKPRSVQIWFQNARQGGEMHTTRETMREMRKSSAIDAQQVFAIFMKNIRDFKE